MSADRRLLTRWLFARWLFAASLVLNWHAHANAAEDSPPGVRIEKGRVDVTLSTSERQHTLPAKIRVSLLLRNSTDKRDTQRRVFSIAAPSMMRFPQPETPWCRVTVNDISVGFEKKRLIDPAEQVREWPNEKQAIAWSRRLEEWFAKDEQLTKLVERYRKLAGVQHEMSELTQTFNERVKRHLIHKDLEYAALNVANDGPNFGYLVNLMPEIEPAYRIDGKFQRWEYVSLLSDGDPEVYRPYEKEWREKADKWFASKPDLILLVPKLRELWASFREGQELIAGPILKHLHDVSGLSLPVAVQLKSFIERGSEIPPTVLLRLLFPDVDAELKKRSAALSKRLRDHGFDEAVVSPFTGRLMPHASLQRPHLRTLRNDETVLAELGRPEKTSPFVQWNREPPIDPMLISFEAPLEAKTAATIVIEYDTVLLPMQDPASSFVSVGAEEIMAVFPSPRDVPFSVTFPAGFQPIISPEPSAVAMLKDGERRFDGRLNGKQTMLHVAAVNFAKDHHSWTPLFRESDLRIRGDVEILVDRISNVTVRPLLMTALYAMHLQKQELWDAHQLSLQIQTDHPDFGALLDSVSSHLYQAREAKKLHEWVMQTAKSPHIKTEEDFERFDPHSGNQGQQLKPAALKALARLLALLREDELNLQEKMGRRFVLCQADVDPQKNLAALLKLAEANPREAHYSLKLIQYLTIEKPSTLPFVINQIDLQLRAKARAGEVKSDSFEWIRQNHAYYAMGTFRSPKTATMLIEFVHSTDDSLLVQGAITALGRMTLPDHFEELTGIADQIAASSASGYIKYLDLLLRSDRDRAVPFLNSLPARHPKLAGYVLRALGESRIQMALPQALEAYRTSKDVEGELSAAITIIAQMAEPNDIAALEYRKGLPDWMNERLVSVFRSKGGDEAAFKFVEAYYNEFVRGKTRQHHVTCVAAFERIGDRRAIPHLREIFKTTERKRDAAKALGNLLLERRIVRPPYRDNEMDRNIRAITEPGSSEVNRAAAWTSLLLTPEKSFDRVMMYSALRSALENADSEWTEDDAVRCSFISGFGDLAAVRLLKESDGCSLHQRYRIAHLLTLLLPGSTELIQKNADDESADQDRRQTAELALKLVSQLEAR